MCDRVGIIEKGKLLATGTVDEIQNNADRDLVERDVVVRTLSNSDGLAKLLSEQESISGVRVDGELVHYVHTGDRAAEAQLLRELIESGLEIAEFRSQQKSLEDLFMEVTRGVVQ